MANHPYSDLSEDPLYWTRELRKNPPAWASFHKFIEILDTQTVTGYDKCTTHEQFLGQQIARRLLREWMARAEQEEREEQAQQERTDAKRTEQYAGEPADPRSRLLGRRAGSAIS